LGNDKYDKIDLFVDGFVVVSFKDVGNEDSRSVGVIDALANLFLIFSFRIAMQLWRHRRVKA